MTRISRMTTDFKGYPLLWRGELNESPKLNDRGGFPGKHSDFYGEAHEVLLYAGLPVVLSTDASMSVRQTQNPAYTIYPIL
jgi:hypothetical protein